jgi:hypothetical protein
MIDRDRELLSRIAKVNSVSGEMVIHVLTGIADDDALSADFANLGQLYKQLGEAFLERAADLSQTPSARLVS